MRQVLDPVVEYRLEGFDMFDAMVDAIREDTTKMLMTVEIRQGEDAPKRQQVAKPTGEGAAESVGVTDGATVATSVEDDADGVGVVASSALA